MLADVVDEQCADGTAVVCGSDGAVSLLAGGIPDLCFDGLVVYLDASGCKFDANGGLAVEVEFIAGEPREQVGFSDAFERLAGAYSRRGGRISQYQSLQ